MEGYSLDRYIADCSDLVRAGGDHQEAAADAAMLLWRLLNTEGTILRPEHLRSDPKHFSHNEVYISSERSFALHALVWAPGQWTEIHNHGDWGVSGILFGALEEQRYRLEGDGDEAKLVKHGLNIMSEGSVACFGPDDDIIHRLGVPEEREPVVAISLTGIRGQGHYVYDPATGHKQFRPGSLFDT